MIRVYVAGAYSSNPIANTIDAINQAERLEALGFDTEVPHLFHWWNEIHEHGYDFWLQKCLRKIERCDVLFRMNNESPGADIEVAHAMKHGVPVVHSEASLCAWRDEQMGRVA